jgi:Secretion system C-terminal sorting domain
MKSLLEKIEQKVRLLKRRYWLVVPVFIVSIPCALGQPEPTCVDTYALDPAVIKAGNVVAYHAGSAIYTPTINPTIGGYIVEAYAKASFQAGRRIELNPGFQVKSNGSFRATIEVCTIPTFSTASGSVSVFPNPTTGALTINSPTTINSVRLTDINGLMKMEKWDINVNVFDLDVSEFKNGFYILEIISGKSIQKVRIEKN